MKIEDARVHALDIALRMNPAAKTLQDITESANAIAAFIMENPVQVPKPVQHVWNAESIAILKQCADDPVAFARWCLIPHPMKGPIPFEPYPFQEDVLRKMNQHRMLVVNQSRQMGLTTCEAIFALWFAAMHPEQTVMIMSNRLVGAFEIISRIRYAAESMPAHLLPNIIVNNKGMIEFDNGSRIYGRACSGESVRGMSISLLILDEFAYVSHTKAYEFVSAVMPVISAIKSSKVIIGSSPGVPDGPFFDIWRDALVDRDAAGVGNNGFAALTIPWTAHPHRDESWAQSFRDALGPARFAQEYENSFVSPV